MKSPLTKHYDKLTARERFAAFMAADIRDDKTEMHALISSAPRKTFSFPHTRGLTDGFEFLSSWHMIKQLGNCAIFFCLMAIPEYYEKLKVIKIDEATYNLDDFALLI